MLSLLVSIIIEENPGKRLKKFIEAKASEGKTVKIMNKTYEEMAKVQKAYDGGLISRDELLRIEIERYRKEGNREAFTRKKIELADLLGDDVAGRLWRKVRQKEAKEKRLISRAGRFLVLVDYEGYHFVRDLERNEEIRILDLFIFEDDIAEELIEMDGYTREEALRLMEEEEVILESDFFIESEEEAIEIVRKSLSAIEKNNLSGEGFQWKEVRDSRP